MISMGPWQLLMALLVAFFFLPAGCQTGPPGRAHVTSAPHPILGIGIKLRISDSRFFIVSVLPDSPALRHGLREGDEVLAVSGQRLAGETLRTAILMIRDTARTPLQLQIRTSSSEVKTLRLERAPLAFVHQIVEEIPAEGYSCTWRSCGCPRGCDSGYCEKEGIDYGDGWCRYGPCECAACA